MILFTILALMVLTLIVTAVIAIVIGGSAFILVFGDIIICVALIVLTMRHILNKKHNKRN